MANHRSRLCCSRPRVKLFVNSHVFTTNTTNQAPSEYMFSSFIGMMIISLAINTGKDRTFGLFLLFLALRIVLVVPVVHLYIMSNVLAIRPPLQNRNGMLTHSP
jgi:hypothetical protein